jgi:protoheme IX farnesyltransferase
MPAVIGISNLQKSFLKEWPMVLLDLVKIRISLMVTFSVATGYILAASQIKMETLVTAVAVFFLSCGSCALNQYQERQLDELMERTKNRPLPSGELTPAMALWIASGLIFSGSLMLFYEIVPVASALGLFAVLWYNGVYTYLKQKTAFAVIPGALIGAIPPVIGWVSGGGSLLDSRVWAVALFFFIWQVPHFWLLCLDFAIDYEKAGFPSLTKIFAMAQHKKIISVWIGSTLVSGLLIPLFGFISFSLTYLFLLTLTFWFLWNGIKFFRSCPIGISFRFAFTKLNLYAFWILFILSLDRLLAFNFAESYLFNKMLVVTG